MTIKFGNFANCIVINFVVIWETPNDRVLATRTLRKACVTALFLSHVGLLTVFMVSAARSGQTSVDWHETEMRGSSSQADST